MATTIYDVPLRHMLSRLRNGQVYKWKGSSALLQLHETLDEVIIWDVLNPDSIPTESEFIAEYDSFLLEIEKEEIDRQEVISETENYQLVRSDYVLAYKLKNKLISSFANGNSPSTDVLYQGFVVALNSSNLEVSIINYVEAMTGLTNFGVGIPIGEKRVIMEACIDFLQSICIVGIVRGFIKLEI